MSILIKGTNIEDLQRAMPMFRGHEIIELPDHGDLIDRSALMKEFAEYVAPSNRSDFVPPPNWNDAVSLLGSAPTVIPAERSEE